MVNVIDNSNNPYLDSKGVPQLRLSYCVYLDILGFSNLVKEKANQGRGASFFVSRYRKYMKLLYEFENQRLLRTPKYLTKFSDVNPQWMIKIFTDNIVLRSPIWTHSGEHELGWLIDSLQYFQLNMVLCGHFLRGSLSFGELTMDENIVYGISLIEAAESEKKDANFPRIILSKSVMEIFTEYTGYYGNSTLSPYYYSYLRDDNNIFVNYLDSVIFGDDYLESNLLKHHKRVIERALSKYNKDDSFYNKYEWLAAYHNEFCEGISHHYDYDSHLLIDGSFGEYNITGIDGDKWNRHLSSPY